MRTRVVEQGGAGRGEQAARLLWGAAEAVVTPGVVVLLPAVHQLRGPTVRRAPTPPVRQPEP